MNKLSQFCVTAISFFFYVLILCSPWLLSMFNYELFEFNKMIAVYALTTTIAGLWITRMIASRQLIIKRTPFDIPLLLFLLSQTISTIVSIDRHTSLWGYYSRFNGGLFSIISFILLYYACVSNLNAKTIIRLLRVGIASTFVVALGGVLEHMGIDKDLWVQDVQNRVFSTLGQPNWLAAYLAIFIPISTAIGLNTISENKPSLKRTIQIFIFFLTSVLFYVTLLFTKSRSGFLGLWVAFALYAVAIFWFHQTPIQQTIKKHLDTFQTFLLTTLVGFILFSLFYGIPFEQFNRFTLPNLQNAFKHTITQQVSPSSPPGGTSLETGGTESGEIRKIVWKGAFDIGKAYPLFGSGVETFAYIYYRFRPVEHNITSEWDFLYNKAHNEYLNYFATTGTFGLATYIFFIAAFLLWVGRRTFQTSDAIRVLFKKLRLQKTKQVTTQTLNTEFVHNEHLILGLTAGFIVILISNFFGFSVVLINLYFFLIPAYVFLLSGEYYSIYGYFHFSSFLKQKKTTPPQSISTLGPFQYSGIVVVAIGMLFLYQVILHLWFSDKDFATGKRYDQQGEFTDAYPYLLSAIKQNPGEPLFKDEASVNVAGLALIANEQNKSTLAGQLVDQAVSLSNTVLKSSPNNPSFYRTRVRVFYSLSQIDMKYFPDTIKALEALETLAPTDPKVYYNYGVVLGQNGAIQGAIDQLEKAKQLKPNYRDAIYALGLFYRQAATDKNGKVINKDLNNKAILQMEDLLKMATADAQASEKIKEWKQQ